MDDKELAIAFSEDVKILKKEIAKVIVGQDETVDGIITSIFCNGHALLIGVPGLAKTLLINTLSTALELSFNRIQFTPDLMPGDITGTEVLGQDRSFKFVKGSIFSNIILADEINRTPPKTQAALLEAMQEKNVTYGGQSYPLPDPFFVLATQNPIEQEGTYPLPEAQLDRFMFNLILDYPNFREELDILKQTTGGKVAKPNKVLGVDKIIEYQNLVKRVPITDHVYEYIVSLVHKTRPNRDGTHDYINKYVTYGAGPRAGQNLVMAAKCLALTKGKFSPDIIDVKEVAKNVLRHRLVRNYKAEAEEITSDQIIEQIL